MPTRQQTHMIADARRDHSGAWVVEDEYAEPSEEEKAFSSFVHEMSESDEYAKIVVFRQPTAKDGRAAQKRLVFLFEAGIDEFSHSQLASYLRDHYGTGTYRLQGRDSGGKIVFNRPLEVEAQKDTERMAAGRQGQESSSEILNSVGTMLMRMQERQEQLLEKFTSKNSGGDMNAMQMMALCMDMSTRMAEAMAGNRPQNAGSDDLIKRIHEIREVGELVGLGDKDRGSENFYSMMTETIRNFGPAFAQVMASAQNNPRLSAPQPQPNPHTPPNMNPQQEPPKMQSINPETPQQSAADAELKKSIDQLLPLAKNGMNPSDVANMVLDATPDEKLDDFYAFISAPDVLVHFQRLNPEVTQYQRWFMELRNEIIAQLAEENAPGDLSGEPLQPESEGASVANERAPATDTGNDANHGNAANDPARQSGNAGNPETNAQHSQGQQKEDTNT